MEKKANHQLAIIPVLTVSFLLICLFVYLILQGDMQDWPSFMGGEASMALFSLYSIIGVAGFIITLFLKKEVNIFKSPRKLLKITFVTSIIIGLGVFTYLNFTASEVNYDWMHDGLLYQQMGQSWLTNQEFIVDNLYTHHFGPMYPIYLSLFYIVLPAHLGTQIAVQIIFSLSIAAVFIATKKLYGLIPALLSTLFVVTNPTFLFTTSRNYSEPLVLILYILTIFFIMESLKPEKSNRIILAGLFAALGFLTKSGLGYFFIITGVAGFLWRFNYMKWNVFKNKNYLLAIAVFLTLVLTWTIRNLTLFWDGTFYGLFSAAQPSQYLNDAVIHSVTKDLGSFMIQFWFFAILSVFFLAPYVLILSPYVKKAFRNIREERISCILLAIVLPIIIGVVMGAAIFIYENEWMPNYWITFYPVSQVHYLTSTLIRYLFIAIIPLSWLAFEVAKKSEASLNELKV